MSQKKESLTVQQLVGIAKGAGFTEDQAVIMAAIAMAESGGERYAFNGNANTGDKSYGLWQINMIKTLGPERRLYLNLTADEELYNPITNARAAKWIFGQQNFNAWSVYKSGKYIQFLPQAKEAKSAPAITKWDNVTNTTSNKNKTPATTATTTKKPVETSEGGWLDNVADFVADVGNFFGQFTDPTGTVKVAKTAKDAADKAKADAEQLAEDKKDSNFSEAELAALKAQFPLDDGTERYKELEIFVTKLVRAATLYRNGRYQSEEWPSTRIQGETIFKSTIENYNVSHGVPPKGIIPTELSMTVDGISGISVGEAFMIQQGILPSKYDNFGFIVVGLDQGIKSNRWYTTIRAQTFNIGEVFQEQRAEATIRITPWGYY